jgi:hypothetical protein
VKRKWTDLRCEAEDWVADLFAELGYAVEQNVSDMGLRIDLVMSRDGPPYEAVTRRSRTFLKCIS